MSALVFTYMFIWIDLEGGKVNFSFTPGNITGLKPFQKMCIFYCCYPDHWDLGGQRSFPRKVKGQREGYLFYNIPYAFHLF